METNETNTEEQKEKNTPENKPETNPPVVEKQQEERKETLPPIDKTKSYSGDEVAKLVSLASKNASVSTKNQLYPEIERLKNKITEVEASMKTASETEKAQLLDEKTQLENANKLLTDKVKEFDDKLKEVSNKTKEIETASIEKTLKDHKDKLIADNKGSIVEDLIEGKTIEELNASLVKSKAKFSEIEENLRSKLNLPKTPTAEEIAEQNKPVNIPRLDVTDQRAASDYRKNRNAARQEVYRKEGFPI